MPFVRRSALAGRSAQARRMSVASRYLFVAVASVAIGACGRLPPGPTDASGHLVNPAPPSATVAASPAIATSASTSSATSATVDEVPRILVRVPSRATSERTWWVTEAGHPERRTPIVAPFEDLELAQASADGSILGTTAALALTVRIDGSELKTTSSMPVPVGRMLLPACYAGDGQAIFADAETLSLVALRDGVVMPFGAIAFTLGECAALADGRTVVAIDGGRLVAIGPDEGSTPIVGALGRHLSTGEGRLAMIDPSKEFGEAVVRDGTVSEDWSLGAVIGAVVGGPAGRVVDARSSPDGHWLAVILERETPTEPEARLRFYRVGDDGLTMATETLLEVGARIIVLAGP
jgi:hypothetical protein